MKSAKLMCISAIALLVALAIPASLAAPDNQQSKDAAFITFDVPGAGKGAGQGTQAYDVNPARAITGSYIDTSNVYHGFWRRFSDGKIFKFDVKGAGTGAGQGTFANAINPKGWIAGYYVDASNVYHGFVRQPNGKVKTIDVKGAGKGAGQGTGAFNINLAGMIAGIYVDASSVHHVFLLSNGKITKVDVPDAGKGSGQGTEVDWPEGINSAGAITGFYIDANNVYHSYVRPPDGHIKTFNVKGAGKGAGQGTVVSGINSTGYTSGVYFDANNANHGFLRAPNGSIKKFDVKGASGTEFTTIDSKHAAAGFYNMNGVHGFLRCPDGTIKKLNAPGAGPLGTLPYSSNPAGAITGYYIDTSNVDHGFLAPTIAEHCSAEFRF